MKNYLNPLSDLVFKRIFGNEKDILMEFINTFIEFYYILGSRGWLLEFSYALRSIRKFSDRWLTFDFWTLFLTEYQQLLTMKTELIPDYPNLIKALNLLDVSGFTPEQLAAYDRYQDNLRNMNSVMISNYKKGLGEGLEKGREEGREEGIEIGQEAGIMLERKRTLSIIKAIQNGQLTMEAIALEHQVSIEFVQQLKGL